MKLFTKKKAPTRQDIRKSRPVRNANLNYGEREDGTVVLRVPLEARGGVYRLLGKVTQSQADKEVELEEIGSFVWNLCDGKHSCEGIASKLKDKYKLTKPEAEASLISFLETLSRRGYVSLAMEKNGRR